MLHSFLNGYTKHECVILWNIGIIQLYVIVSFHCYHLTQLTLLELWSMHHVHTVCMSSYRLFEADIFSVCSYMRDASLL